MSDDFRDLLAALVAEKARFLVIGAHSLAVHGVPRMTRDLDLLVEPAPYNARRVWRALAAFGPPLESLDVRESDFAIPDVVAQIGIPPYRVDILTTINGVSFAEAWKDRLEDRMLGVEVSFIGLEALFRNKRATGRTQDLADIESLGG